MVDFFQLIFYWEVFQILTESHFWLGIYVQYTTFKNVLNIDSSQIR